MLKLENTHQQPEIHSGGRTDPPKCELLAGCAWTRCVSEPRYWLHSLCLSSCLDPDLLRTATWQEWLVTTGVASIVSPRLAAASPACALPSLLDSCPVELWSSDDLLCPEQSFRSGRIGWESHQVAQKTTGPLTLRQAVHGRANTMQGNLCILRSIPSPTTRGTSYRTAAGIQPFAGRSRL